MMAVPPEAKRVSSEEVQPKGERTYEHKEYCDREEAEDAQEYRDAIGLIKRWLKIRSVDV
jgi:hypothetical protein